MSRFSQLFSWLTRSEQDNELRSWFKHQPLPPVLFASVKNVNKPPKLGNVEENEFYFVSQNNQPKWVIFQCPCGCSSIVTLSLQKVHRPRWALKESDNSRPVLFPSVWRDTGCLSHFWVDDGRVYWCRDSGTSPFSKYVSD